MTLAYGDANSELTNAVTATDVDVEKPCWRLFGQDFDFEVWSRYQGCCLVTMLKFDFGAEIWSMFRS